MAAEHAAPDLIVLDVSLPGLDGRAVCRRLRAKGLATPILMLTARLRALTRRGHATPELVTYGDLTLDVEARAATRGGRSITLTGREASLLALLLREAGRVVTRERALIEIWDDAAVDNVVDRYVTRLRRKLGEPPLIRTVRGSGFALRA